MRALATVAAAIAMAAASCTGVHAAASTMGNDGLDHLHASAQDFFGGFGNLFSLRWQDLQDTSWLPLAGLRGRPIEQGGAEAIRAAQHDFLYLTGGDAWRHWAFMHAGVLWSPAGLDNEGLTVKLLASGGAYRYVSTTLDNSIVVGRNTAVTIMPGWRFKRLGYEFTIFAGLDYQQIRYLPDDPGATLRGTRTGLRTALEVWHEPTSSSMLAADASISSIRAGNYARIAYGWRVFDRFYLGPELQAYSTQNYRHARVGMHVTASKNYEHEWSGAIGVAEDSDGRSGIYFRIGYLTRR